MHARPRKQSEKLFCGIPLLDRILCHFACSYYLSRKTLKSIRHSVQRSLCPFDGQDNASLYPWCIPMVSKVLGAHNARNLSRRHPITNSVDSCYFASTHSAKTDRETPLGNRANALSGRRRAAPQSRKTSLPLPFRSIGGSRGPTGTLDWGHVERLREDG